MVYVDRTRQYFIEYKVRIDLTWNYDENDVDCRANKTKQIEDVSCNVCWNLEVKLKSQYLL